MPAGLLVGCGGSDTATTTDSTGVQPETKTETTSDSADAAATTDTAVEQGKIVNIYCWNDEFKSRYEAYAADLAETHGVEVNFVIVANENNAYQNNLDAALMAQETAAIEEVEIDFWHHYSAQSAENETLMNVLIPKFEEENPGIKVNAVSHEWADLHQKILISAQSDTLPDVARLDSAWIPEFQASGMLVALDEEMEDFATVSEGLLESAMSTAALEGHAYGLALNTNTKILFYNVEAFEEAGISAPKTMDEFVEACKTLAGTNADGQQVMEALHQFLVERTFLCLIQLTKMQHGNL